MNALAAPVFLAHGLATVEALVEQGLKAGETVVVYPSDTLADGSRVDIRNATKR